MYFLQTSAKSCDNVDRLFTEIAHELLQQVLISMCICICILICICICRRWGEYVTNAFETFKTYICRQRQRTCRASLTAFRTYLTQLGKTPHKWNRTAVQKSFETPAFQDFSFSSSRLPKLPRILWSLGAFQTCECPRKRWRSATCRRKWTLGIYFPMTNHQHVWIEMTQAHLSPES